MKFYIYGFVIFFAFLLVTLSALIVKDNSEKNAKFYKTPIPYVVFGQVNRGSEERWKFSMILWRSTKDPEVFYKELVPFIRPFVIKNFKESNPDEDEKTLNVIVTSLTEL